MKVARWRTLVLAAALLRAAGLLAGEPEDAEYAVRWDPTQGGPGTVRELLALLGAPEDGARSYEVRYFDFPPPSDAPPGATPILRLRTRDDGRTDLRLKYRSDRPLSERWRCPADGRWKKSEELDVAFGGGSAPSSVYAYSCTTTAKTPPASLGAAPKPCAARMVRYEHGGDKIEEWTLPGGAIRLEVSRSTSNEAKHEQRFAELVQRLVARGVKALEESKTELGSRCPESKSP